MKLKNIFLATSLISFAIGFLNNGDSFFWSLGLPMGAILFGLFLIFMVLEKETELLDEQSRCENCGNGTCSGKSRSTKSRKGDQSPSFTSAPSH